MIDDMKSVVREKKWIKWGLTTALPVSRKTEAEPVSITSSGNRAYTSITD
jgi:hypothetical protein